MTQSAEQLQKRAEKLAEQDRIEREQLLDEMRRLNKETTRLVQTINDENAIEIRRMNEETAKFVQDAHKARNEGDLAAKKTNWFEFSMLLALVAATIAATKAFL